MRTYRSTFLLICLSLSIFSFGSTPTTEKTAPAVAEPNTPPLPQLDDPNFLKARPKKDPFKTVTQGILPWAPVYHPQVTPELFHLISYPYYPGGAEFIDNFGAEQPAELSWPDPGQISLTNMLPEPPASLGLLAHSPPNELAAGKLPDPEAARGLAKYCDFLYQWRQINEAPGTSLEVLHTVQLTRAASGIYDRQADLAVGAKRTLGQIGRVNRYFDGTRKLLLAALAEKGMDKVLLARMEKYLGELKGLLENLARQNDAMSQSMGLGKLERDLSRPAAWEPVDYTHDRLPRH